MPSEPERQFERLVISMTQFDEALRLPRSGSASTWELLRALASLVDAHCALDCSQDPPTTVAGLDEESERHREEWLRRLEPLLGDEDRYMHSYPTDGEVTAASLAQDLATIAGYVTSWRNASRGFASPEDAVQAAHFSFHVSWGMSAFDAMRVIFDRIR